MSNKIIELKGLTKNFDDQQVLKGIDLNIYENEFLTLLGPSGCGKTTILRIIAGFEEPSKGELLFNGIDISKVPPYKREINTVFQKYALFPFLDVHDNVAFGLNLKKVDKSVVDQKVSRMLKLVGLEGFEKRDVTLLSGGMNRRFFCLTSRLALLMQSSEKRCSSSLRRFRRKSESHLYLSHMIRRKHFQCPIPLL